MLGDWPTEPGLWISLVVAGGAYALGVHRLHARGKPWSSRRSASLAGGLLAIGAALVSPLAVYDEQLPVHMVQHLLLGKIGPLLLALSAPVTLVLRTIPRRPRITLVGVLHSRPIRLLAHPVTAITLFDGGFGALYFTPLYGATLRHPLLHELVHTHFLISGCLLAWTFVGLDPVPRLGSLRLRTALLIVALGTHAALAKLLFAGYGSVRTGGVAQLHQGAEIMYYGGDFADLMLLTAFFAQWYVREGRRLRRRQGTKEAAGRVVGGDLAAAG